MERRPQRVLLLSERLALLAQRDQQARAAEPPRNMSQSLFTPPPLAGPVVRWITSKFRVPYDWVVMDLETTGLGQSAEVIEIAIVSANGAVLLNQLVMPKGRIPKRVTSKTGIDRRLLRGCPHWPEIDRQVRDILRDRSVITYNADFDVRMLQQTTQKWSLPPIGVQDCCAMISYAKYRGIKHPWRKGEFKWHKMVDALRHEGIAHGKLHRALPDAMATRELVLRMIDSPRPWRAWPFLPR